MTEPVKLVRLNGAVLLIGKGPPASASIEPRKSEGGVWHEYRDGIEKLWIDKTGKRMIEGIASTGAMSSHKHSLNPRGCIARLPIPLLFGHGFKKDTRQYAFKTLESARIGEVVALQKSKEAVTVRAILDDSLAADAAWGLIESGKARCFSVAVLEGSDKMKGVVDGNLYFDQWELREVSVCFKGANPDCYFSIVSS